MGLLKGYRVDTNKHELNNLHEVHEKYFLSDQPSKKGKKVKAPIVRHGEILSKKQVKKMGLSEKFVEKYLVPIKIDKKDLHLEDKGCLGRNTIEVNFGAKPEIDGNYKANRLNSTQYKKSIKGGVSHGTAKK